ncbi:MAG TPA: radical SAM protein [Pseudonocardiaceae bacterium]|nr:radical SAM protein [Pseudonocardiaceae bacterium]
MRLIRGSAGWWCITRSGTALVPDSLVHQGKLTHEAMRQLAAAGVGRVPDVRRYRLTVVTATGCNLGCPYCFQNSAPARPGTFAPARIAAAVLDSGTITEIVAFAAERAAAAGAPELDLLLFGGEPLLNPRGCLDVLRHCAERLPTTGGMVTNGVLLGRTLAVRLAAAGLVSAQVTVDGPRTAHDAVRTTRAGRGTFDTVLANVAEAQAATDLAFTLRLNVTPAALAGVEELLDHAAAVLDPGRTRFVAAPLLDYGWGFAELPVPAAVVRCHALARARGFRIPLPGPAHCDYCSVPGGSLGAVVNADGALYSCWESIGRPGRQVGTVTTGYADGLGERWTTCGDLAGNTGAMRRFTDQVDAGLLDLARAGWVDHAAAGRG